MAIVRNGYTDFASFPVTGAVDIIYVDLSNGNEYTWATSAYVAYIPAQVTVSLGNKDAAWFAANPSLLLAKGQHVDLGITGLYKLGTGVTELQSLPFLGNMTTIQDGLQSGGGISVVSDDISVAPASWLISPNVYATLVGTDFLNIALSSAGNQRYIGFYGNTSNAIVKVEGSEAAIASYPTQPANTIIIGFVLVGDANISILPDLSGYEEKVNKATTMIGNESSNIVYLAAKAIYDWATGYFATIASLGGYVKKGTIANNTILKGSSTDTATNSNITDNGTTVTVNSDFSASNIIDPANTNQKAVFEVNGMYLTTDGLGEGTPHVNINNDPANGVKLGNGNGDEITSKTSENILNHSTKNRLVAPSNEIDGDLLSTSPNGKSTFTNQDGSTLSEYYDSGTGDYFSAGTQSNSAILGAENGSNQSTVFSRTNGNELYSTTKNVLNSPLNEVSQDPTTPLGIATKQFAEGLVAGLLDDRGSYVPNATTTTYPTGYPTTSSGIGGSGVGGTIMKGDLWFFSAGGYVGSWQVNEGGSIRAIQDSPSSDAGWDVLASNIGYVPENVTNKTDTVAGNTTSSTLYLSVKGYYDYLVGLTWLTDLLFGTWINGLNSKTTPVDADQLMLMDSADSNKTKKLSWANLKATLASTFLSAANNLSELTNFITARNNLKIHHIFLTAGNQSTTSGTAVNITELVFTPAINKRYKFDGTIYMSCTGVGGVKPHVILPAGATIVMAFEGSGASNQTINSTLILASATFGSFSLNNFNGSSMCKVNGEIQMSSTAGDIQFAFAAGTATTQTATINQLGTGIKITQLD